MSARVLAFPHAALGAPPCGPFRALGYVVTDGDGLPIATVSITGRLTPTSTLDEVAAVDAAEKALAVHIADCLNQPARLTGAS